jgi:hypothetical protein
MPVQETAEMFLHVILSLTPGLYLLHQRSGRGHAGPIKTEQTIP